MEISFFMQCKIADCQGTQNRLKKGLCSMHYSRQKIMGQTGSGKMRKSIHYMTGTPEYRSYNMMLTRCYNKNNQAYKDYGGRGIGVCDRWLGVEGFKNFFYDMGRRPDTSFSLERNNNNAGYSPYNCKWATKTEQANNRRARRTRLCVYKNCSNKHWGKGYCSKHYQQHMKGTLGLDFHKTPGVSWRKASKKWIVCIYVKRHRIHLGYFLNKEDAIKARKDGEAKYWSLNPGKVTI